MGNFKWANIKDELLPFPFFVNQGQYLKNSQSETHSESIDGL